MQRHLRSTSISFSKYNDNFSRISSYFNFVVFLSNIPPRFILSMYSSGRRKKSFAIKNIELLVPSKSKTLSVTYFPIFTLFPPDIKYASPRLQQESSLKSKFEALSTLSLRLVDEGS